MYIPDSGSAILFASTTSKSGSNHPKSPLKPVKIKKEYKPFICFGFFPCMSEPDACLIGTGPAEAGQINGSNGNNRKVSVLGRC